MPIGGALGFVIGDFAQHLWGWRNAFLVVGGPGVVSALLCVFIVEPERKLATEKASIVRDARTLARVDLYRKGVIGYCAYTAAIGAFSLWAPKFVYATYGTELASAKFGLVTVIGGLIGTLIGGRWADRAAGVQTDGADRERVLAMLRVCAIGSAVGAPLAAAAFLAPTAPVFFALALPALVFLFLNTSPVNAVILQAVPSEYRASAMALSIFAIHVFGDLWSPPLVGFLADRLPMTIAMMTLPIAIAISAWVWWPRRSTHVPANR
jgi:predicted MFS family arabinose efflux permease